MCACLIPGSRGMFRGEQQLEEEGGCSTNDTRSMTHSSHPNASTLLHNWRLLQCFRYVIRSILCSNEDQIPEGNVKYVLHVICRPDDVIIKWTQNQYGTAVKFTLRNSQHGVPRSPRFKTFLDVDVSGMMTAALPNDISSVCVFNQRRSRTLSLS